MTRQYLTFFPQFCREPVNDEAWYPGFNDWHLIQEVAEGMRDRFVPASGYYDLASGPDIDMQFRQLTASPWPGMALYHYFFDGRFVLGHVERQILIGKAAVPSFFIIWANETWTKRWVGKPNEIIIRQYHSTEPSVVESHVGHLSQLFEHSSYKHENGRPIFVIYAAHEIDNLELLLDVYRAAFARRGHNPKIGFCVPYVDPGFRADLFDFSLEFQPRLFFNVVRSVRHDGIAKMGLMLKKYSPRLFDFLTSARDFSKRRQAEPQYVFEYEDYLQLAEGDAFGSMLESTYRIPCVRTLFYSWNNFPRYRGSAVVVRHRQNDFAAFTSLADRLKTKFEWSVINSWNEWSEGAALEPGKMDIRKYDLREDQ